MSPLLGPILAQLVSLGVSDRTEVRYLALDPGILEASTSPRAGLNFDWKHTTLTLAYGPSFTLTPLNSVPDERRQLLVFHNLIASASYRFRHTTFAATEALGFGQLEVQTLAFGGPGVLGYTAPAGTTAPAPGSAPPVPVGGVTGTGSPTTMNTGATQVSDTNGRIQVLKYVASSSDLSVTQVVSPVLRVFGDLGYVITGGYGPQTPTSSPMVMAPNALALGYPLVKGPRATAAASYRFTRRDLATSTLYVQESSAATLVDDTGPIPTVSGGTKSWVATANESWGHALDPQTSTLVGVGLGVTRSTQLDGHVSSSPYPTFNASITRAAPLGRGVVSYGLGISAAPVIDAVDATVDPRLTFLGLTGWSRNRFSANAGASSTLSLSSQGNSTSRGFNSLNGSLILGYRLSTAFSLDSGLRLVYQHYASQTTVPLTWSAFLGLTFAAATPL